MTEEQIKKSRWLNRAFYKDIKVQALKSLKDRDRERAEGMNGDSDDNSESKSETPKNGTYEAYMKYLETEEKYQQALCEYNTVRKEIEAAIEALNDDELEAVFVFRYLEGKHINEIAEEMHYDTRTIIRKHKAGLDKLSPNVIACHPSPVV